MSATVADIIAIILSPVAILVASYLGYHFSEKTRKEEKQRERAEHLQQVSTINSLMRKEITERWKGKIHPTLLERLELYPANPPRREPDSEEVQPVSVEKLERYLATEFSSHDLHTIEWVAHNFDRLYFLGEDILDAVSTVHTTVHDFVDRLKIFNGVYQEKIKPHVDPQRATSAKPEHIDESVHNAFGDTIHRKWKNDKDSLAKIDDAMDKLRTAIGQVGLVGNLSRSPPAGGSQRPRLGNFE